ncbi:hypothetical protein J3459_017231 [Metarhizium acridum]|nr:hypothetical protein J3459_017231 [Metarhizium acridum]
MNAAYRRQKPSLKLLSIPRLDHIFALQAAGDYSSAMGLDWIPDVADASSTSVILLPAKECFYDLPESLENMTAEFPASPCSLVTFVRILRQSGSQALRSSLRESTGHLILIRYKESGRLI